MKHRLPFYGKISALVLGCLLCWGVGRGQIGYWSTLGGRTPFPSTIGPASSYFPNHGTMIYNNGLLYVPYHDGRIKLAVWDGLSWQTHVLPDSFDGGVFSFAAGGTFTTAADNNGNIYICGGSADTPYSRSVVIKWDGNSFSKVGNSLYTNPHSSGYNNVISSICKDSAGNIYVGGGLTDSAGNNYVAKWDGNNWNFLGNPTNLDPGPSWTFFGEGIGAYGGNVYAVGDYGIMKYGGNNWINIDTPHTHVANSFIIGKTGKIYASLNKQVAMWNGSTWTQLGDFAIANQSAFIANLYLDSAENVYATGTFTDTQGYYCVKKWNGNTWSELGTNNLALHANWYITSLAFSTTGDSIFALGLFTDGITDSSGLPYVAVYTTVPAGRLFAYLTASASNCGGNSGSVSSSVYQGAPPYIYAWSNGATTANIDSLANGHYYLTVTDNAGRITTGDIVLSASCQSIITGHIFIDSTNTCIYSDSQSGVPGVNLSLYGGGQTFYANTDATGSYYFTVSDTGTYVIAASAGSGCRTLTLCGNQTQTITVNLTGDTIGGNDFGSFTPLTFDLGLHPGWTTAHPGFEKEYWVMPYNLSPIPLTDSVIIIFTYDTVLTFASASAPLPIVDPIAHTLTWTISGSSVPSPSFNWNTERFTCYFQVPASLSLTYQIKSRFVILPVLGDCDTINNYYTFSEPVTGSHDPNFKEVSPSGNLLNGDSILTYTIHYQNTGTDSTYFIRVTDTLSPYLDPASVRNLASSAPYSSFNISGTGLLTWAFVPYSLPDSSTDQQASKGFITFSVKKKSNVPVGANITNSAAIYFDYAAAVLTNTVSDTVQPTRLTLNICSNDTFFIGSHYYTQTGVYYDTLTNIHGNDSILTLNLTFSPVLRSSINEQICNGDSVNFMNRWYKTTGNYPDTLTAIGGCDSIVTLNLGVSFILQSTLTEQICTGDSFFFANRWHSIGGDYDTIYTAQGGCDSIVTLHLTINPTNHDTLTQSICHGDTFYIGTYAHTQTGRYTDTLSNINGCDSIVTLNLTVGAPLNISLSYTPDSICAVSLMTFTANPSNYQLYLFYEHDSLIMQSGWGSYVTYDLQPGDSVSVRAFNGTCYTPMVSSHPIVHTIPPAPVLTSSADSICGGDTVTFTASSGYAGYMFYNASSMQQSGTSNIWRPGQLGQGNDIYVYGEQSGCSSLASHSISIVVKPTPIVVFDLSTIRLCADSLVNDTISVVAGEGTYYVYVDSVLMQSGLQTTYLVDSLRVNDVVTVICNLDGCPSQPSSVVLMDEHCVGISTIVSAAHFALYPNPADDYVMIDFDDAYTGSTIFVKDITGRELIQTKLTGSPQQLPTGGLPAGVYLVTLYNNGQMGARLLVKE